MGVEFGKLCHLDLNSSWILPDSRRREVLLRLDLDVRSGWASNIWDLMTTWTRYLVFKRVKAQVKQHPLHVPPRD